MPANTIEVPEVDMLILSAATIRAVEKFFQNPANQREFEEWKKQRNHKKRR